MNRHRVASRKKQLILAIAKIDARLGDMNFLAKFGGRAQRMKERRVQFEQSLSNIQQFGVERIPNYLPDGVNIDVPGG